MAFCSLNSVSGSIRPLHIKLDVGFKDTIAEAGVGYWVFGTDRTDWEVIGGARYTRQKLDVSVKNGPDLLNIDEDWWVGFFGVGSGETNRIWNLVGMFDYRFRDWGSVFAGYKYMNYDYDNGENGFDRYAYNATQQGPLVGLNFHW